MDVGGSEITSTSQDLVQEVETVAPSGVPIPTWTWLVPVVLAAAIGAMAFCRWFLLLWLHRNQGLDPSDESLYLATAAAPTATVSRFSDFGFYTHLLT